MDFPFFDYDFFGNRFLIAWGAILHILINHPMAIGASLLIACMESRGHRLGDQRWDDLARRMLFVCFIVTTTVGALLVEKVLVDGQAGKVSFVFRAAGLAALSAAKGSA
jgi:hypothetical protein